MDISRNIGIYKITNLVNGKVYIGQSRTLNTRVNDYKRLDCKAQRKIYNSIKKYGWDNFTFEVLCNCDIEDLNFWEYDYYMIYQELLGKDMMLNLRVGGGQNVFVSKETRQLQREAQSGTKNHNYGKQRTETTRFRIGDAQKGDKNHMYGKFGSEHHGAVKINQYTIDGKYIKTWDCIKDIKQIIKNVHVTDVCQYKRNYSHGYIWRYHSEYPDCEDLDISKK